MEQILVIVLIVAAVAIATMYLMRKRRAGGPSVPAQAEAPKAPPVPPTPAAPAAPPVPAGALFGPSASTPLADIVVTDLPAPGEIDDEDAVLKLRAIELNGTATNKQEAIPEAGKLLVAAGAVDDSYIESMFERERSVSTYMGNLLAIPHGTNEAMRSIQSSAVSVVRYPDGIEWNGNPVKFVIGIAAGNGEHLELLGRIAEVFLDEVKVSQLEQAGSADEVWRILAKING